jgi:hypothetical protein
MAASMNTTFSANGASKGGNRLGRVYKLDITFSRILMAIRRFVTRMPFTAFRRLSTRPNAKYLPAFSMANKVRFVPSRSTLLVHRALNPFRFA